MNPQVYNLKYVLSPIHIEYSLQVDVEIIGLSIAESSERKVDDSSDCRYSS